jgi:hypothetical protein
MNKFHFSLRLICLLGTFLVSNQLASSAIVPWLPPLRLVQTIERRVVMPKGARQLKSYTRYYSGKIVDGKKIVFGIFEYKIKSHGGIKIVTSEYLPGILDGGCDVVDFAYQVLENKVTQISCRDDI